MVEFILHDRPVLRTALAIVMSRRAIGTIISLCGLLRSFMRLATAFRTRANRHSCDPDHGCCEIDEACKMDGSAIVARRETTKIFKAIEASLDTVSVL